MVCTSRRYHPQIHPVAGLTRSTLLLLVAMIPDLRAGELQNIEITSHRNVYHIDMAMIVHAPAHSVREILTDYVHIYRLDPSITESEILPAPDNDTVRVHTRMLGCVLFFCKEVNRVEDVQVLASGDLQAVIVPELGNIRSGRATWTIRDRGECSQVLYRAHMEPDFFVPPIIGSYFLRQTLQRKIVNSFKRLEHIARLRMDPGAAPGQRLAGLDDTAGCPRPCKTSGTNC